jgi:hypothetical protein
MKFRIEMMYNKKFDEIKNLITTPEYKEAIKNTKGLTEKKDPNKSMVSKAGGGGVAAL